MNEETSAGTPPDQNPLPVPGIPRAMGRWLQRGPYRHPFRWLALAAILCAVALALPSISARYLRSRYALPEASLRSCAEFVALAFDGPGSPEAPSVDRFREQLAALREAGFQCIGLEDVRALFREGRPLPRRAALLTVDGCAPSAWGAWRRSVLQARARAVLFVDPESRRRPDWRSLRYAVMTPHWEVGAAYREWPREVVRPPEPPPEPAGTTTFESARRYERLSMLQMLALDRHRRFRADMRRPFPTPVMALAYPCDVDGSPAIADLLKNVLAETATDMFELGFMGGGLALNNHWSDPRRLNRMRVSPEWTGRELVARLQAQYAADFRFGRQVGELETAAWSPVFGSAETEGSEIVLRGGPDAPGVGLWLAGSDRMTEFAADLEFTLDGGVWRFLFLAAPDESRRWELRMSADGTMRLVRVESGTETEAARDVWTPGGGRHRLKVLIRSAQVLARLDGQNAFGGWVNLNETPMPGRIGVRLLAPEKGIAEARLASLRVAPEESVIAVYDLPPEMTPYALEWAGRHAAEVSAISPPVERMGAAAPPIYGIEADRVLRLAARVHRWNLIPHLDLRDVSELEAWTAERLTQRLENMDGDGLMVRLDPSTGWLAPDIVAWTRRAADALHARGWRLLVRLPDSVREEAEAGRLFATMPGVQWVVGAEVPAERRRDMAVEWSIGAMEVEEDLRRYYEVLAGTQGGEADETRRRVRRWRDEAENLFSAGEYERAVSLWFDWHEAEPGQPYPLRRIGDALLRLGYRDEAVDFYRQSPERDPGNVPLAVQTAELMGESGGTDRAANLLRAYAVVFPHSDVVMLSQARWFRGRGRLQESLALTRRALEINPENLQAAILLAELSREPDDQRAALARLARLGDDPQRRIEVLRAMYESNLLTFFHSDPLLDFLNAIPEKEWKENPRLAEWRSLLLPRSTGVSEELFDRPVSDAWRIEGAVGTSEARRFHLAARPEREEFIVRLLGTDCWRDGFLEVELDDFSGECWLAMRRSAENLVRFGADRDQEQMFLQLWRRDGDRLALGNYHAAPWTGRAGGLRLRLETRGTAAVGFVNGRLWEPGVLPLPRDLTPGWLALIGRTADPGKAWMAVRRISAGPLHPCLALMEGGVGGRFDEVAAALRPHIGHLNGISPAWFDMDPNGELKGGSDESDDFFRLFARYHGFRLLPQIQVAPGAAVRASDLADAAEIHRVDGFLLQFGEPPSSAMLRELSRQLTAYPLDVLACVNEETAPERPRLIGLGRAALLMPGMPPEGLPARRLMPEAALAEKDLNASGPVLIRF